MSRRKKAASEDGIYKITIGGDAPVEVVMTVVIEMFLAEIGLSTETLAAGETDDRRRALVPAERWAGCQACGTDLAPLTINSARTGV